MFAGFFDSLWENVTAAIGFSEANSWEIQTKSYEVKLVPKSAGKSSFLAIGK